MKTNGNGKVKSRQIASTNLTYRNVPSQKIVNMKLK